MTILPVRIGTRGSPLALIQAEEVRSRLFSELENPGQTEIVRIRTSGDRLQQGMLSEAGGKGLFTKEIEFALLNGEIDLAVHSLKDVPTQLPDGLVIDCFLQRSDPRDALISPRASKLDDLPTGSMVGTASLRRKALLLNWRPDLRVTPLRGNVNTRLKRVEDGDIDAALLAVAGLRRLGWHKFASPLTPTEMLPAACQGIIGVERRADDERMALLLERLNDAEAMVAAIAERSLLAGLDGSCRTPIAALATCNGSGLRLRSAIVRPDGSELLKDDRSGEVREAKLLGEAAADTLLSRADSGFFHG